MLITHKITMDIQRFGIMPYLDVVCGDAYTRQLELTLFSGGAEWNVPDGVSAVVRYSRSDGYGGLYDTLPDGKAACSIDKNVVTAILAPQVLSAPGFAKVSVALVKEEQILGLFPVGINVKADPSQNVIPAENYYNYPTIGDINKAIASLERRIYAVEIAISNGSSDTGIIPNNGMVNASYFGLAEGVENFAGNSEVLQTLIDDYGDDYTIYIPAGVYVFTEQIDLGKKRSIHLAGATSGFPALLNRDSNLVPADVGTQIVFVGEANTAMFKHENCFIDLEKLIFKNSVTRDGITVGTLYQNYLFEYDNSTDNTKKGKIFARECGFYGWKCAIGYWYAGPEVDGEAPERKAQCAILANRCRFSSNIVGVNNPLDSRLVDCSFNTNTYAIMHYQANSGYTTVSNCRLEWNKKNHVYEDDTHDNSYIGCEFDRSSEAGVNVHNSRNLNISNCVFRRSGADEELGANDYDRNVHLHISGCENVHVENNTYVVQQITDNGGIKRPSNTIYMHDCLNSQCVNNDFTAGCTRAYPHMGCRFEYNKTTYVANNNGDHNHEYVMDYVADQYIPIPGFCKRIISNTTPISLFGYNPAFSWKVGRLYKAGTIDETATSYAYSDCLILSSLLKRIALPDNVQETQRVYYNADGTVNADETSAGEGTYCKIGIKHNTGADMEQYLKQLYYGVQYASDMTFIKVSPNGTVCPVMEADVYDPEMVVNVPDCKPAFWSTEDGTIVLEV